MHLDATSPPSPSASFCSHQVSSALQGLTHRVAEQRLQDGQTREGCRWRPQSPSLLSNPLLQTKKPIQSQSTAAYCDSLLPYPNP